MAVPRAGGAVDGEGRGLVEEQRQKEGVQVNEPVVRAEDLQPAVDGFDGRRFPQDLVEVTVGPHRADLRVPNGSVVEFQHSSIPPREIRVREKFYGRLVWVIDAASFARNIRLYERTGYADMPDVRFRWQWRHETWKNANCPLFLDFSDGLPQDAAAGWTYVGCENGVFRNALRFHGIAIPEPLSRVQAKYNVDVSANTKC